MTDIQLQETSVNAITPESSVEQIADVLFTLAGMARRIKELQADLDERMIEHIKATGQDIVIGTVRYYIGKPKTIKSRDDLKTLETLLEISGGDLGRVVQCLSANAFKHGTVKRMLEELKAAPETFDLLFETVEREKLEEGKPRLMKLDTQYLK
jgi:hypothetical protein